jgi:hypothetical protein
LVRIPAINNVIAVTIEKQIAKTKESMCFRYNVTKIVHEAAANPEMIGKINHIIVL